jgi:polar amino acid transport system substrate-binding protein
MMQKRRKRGEPNKALMRTKAFDPAYDLKKEKSIRKRASFLLLGAALFAAVFLVLTAGCGGSGNSGGSPVVEEPIEGVLRVGIYDLDLPPLFYLGSDGKLAGFEIDLLEEVAGRLGRELEYVRITDEYADALRAGEVDVVWGNVFISSTTPGVLLSRPYLKTEQVAVVARDSGIEKKEDLEGKEFATLMWTPADQLIKLGVIELNPTRIRTSKLYRSTFDSLNDESISAVLCDETMAEYMMGELGDGFFILAETLGEVRYAAALRPDDTRTLEKIESALEDIGADGAGEKLSRQWFGKNLYIK